MNDIPVHFTSRFPIIVHQHVSIHYIYFYETHKIYTFCTIKEHIRKYICMFVYSGAILTQGVSIAFIDIVNFMCGVKIC